MQSGEYMDMQTVWLNVHQKGQEMPKLRKGADAMTTHTKDRELFTFNEGWLAECLRQFKQGECSAWDTANKIKDAADEMVNRATPKAEVDRNEAIEFMAKAQYKHDLGREQFSCDADKALYMKTCSAALSALEAKYILMKRGDV